MIPDLKRALHTCGVGSFMDGQDLRWWGLHRCGCLAWAMCAETQGRSLLPLRQPRSGFHAIWLGILAPLCLLDQPGAAIALLRKTAADMLAP